MSASDRVELLGRTADGRFPSGLFASSEGTGAAGNLTITTGQLLVRNGAQVAVNSRGTSSAPGGNLEVTARTIRLDNQG